MMNYESHNSESVNLKKARESFEKFLSTCSFNSLLEQYGDSVSVTTDDGCFFLYQDSFVLEMKDSGGTWYCVVPEHHSLHIFHTDDVVAIRCVKNSKNGMLEITNEI